MARGAAQIQWILFDLGDVIVDYQPRGVSHMARDLGVGVDVVDAALASDLVEEACTGALSPPDLAQRLSKQLGVMISGEDMARWFAADVATVFPELVPILEILSWHHQLGILSNTFFAHWDAFLELPVAGLFEQKMASHLLGLLKPDERIYRAALTRMDTQPEHVLFIDDKLENVEAARAIGMDAFQSTSPAETIRGLEQREILPTFAPPPAVTRERFLEWRSPRCSTLP